MGLLRGALLTILAAVAVYAQSTDIFPPPGALNTANTWTVGNQVFAGPGAASTSSVRFTGTLFSGGTSSTTWPLIYIDLGASEPTSWNTNGTLFGINAPTGAGQIADWHNNGGSTVFSVDPNGTTRLAGGIRFGNPTTKTTTYSAASNDTLIIGDGTGGAFTLSAAGSPSAGQIECFLKKDSSANAITVSGNGKNIYSTSGSVTTLTLGSQGNAYCLWYDGTQWWVFAKV